MATVERSKVPLRQSDRRVYKNPPIAEATCEFQFAPIDNWTLAHAGLFLERVKGRYAGKPREQRLLQVEGNQLANLAGALPTASVREVTKVQIPSEDGSKMVAVGPGVLSVHVMKPYSGWENFRPQIAEALETCQEIAQPTGIRRIGIRYINVLDLPTPESEPMEYIAAPPTTKAGIDGRLDTFVIHHEYTYADEPIRLLVNIAKVKIAQDSNKTSYMLDLDVVREWQSDPLPLTRAMSMVDKLRSVERDAFEAHITPKARELFDA